MHGIVVLVRRIGIASALVGCGPSARDSDSTESASEGSTQQGTDDGDSDGGPRPGNDTSIATTVADGGADSTGGGGLSQTAACAAYLTCAAATTPAELGALLEAYGPEGTCWQSTPEVAEQCDTACMAGLAQLQAAFCDEPACGGGGACTSGSSGGGEPGPPMIVSVSWTNVPGCTQGTGSDVDFVIDVSDPDHGVSDLLFSGFAIGCSGSFDGATSTLFCPNAASYTAEVVVADPLGNEDSIDFTFSPCVDGSAP